MGEKGSGVSSHILYGLGLALTFVWIGISSHTCMDWD